MLSNGQTLGKIERKEHSERGATTTTGGTTRWDSDGEWTEDPVRATGSEPSAVSANPLLSLHVRYFSITLQEVQ